LSRRELAEAFASLMRACSAIVALWATEARFRTDFLPDTSRGLQRTLRWVVGEMRGPVDRRAALRRKLDRREPRLSATLSVQIAARRAQIRPPSDSELAALAVLVGSREVGQAPTPRDDQRRTYWRTMRRRAQRLVTDVEPLIGDIHATALKEMQDDDARFILHRAEHAAAITELEREATALLDEDLATRGTDGAVKRRRSVPGVRPKVRSGRSCSVIRVRRHR
jgi:hypothetical protein